MELKPENKNTNPKYPDEDNIEMKHLKKPLNRWQKLGITAAVLTALGTAGYFYIDQQKTVDVTGGVMVEMHPDAKIQLFNSSFLSFNTTSLNKKQIYHLISIVISKNNLEKTVSINNIDEDEKILEYYNSLPDDKPYSIEFDYDLEGYICNINISETEQIKEDNNVSINKITKKDFIKNLKELIDLYNHNGLA